MSAISFIYNLEAKSLTLSDEEQEKTGLFTSPGKFKRALNDIGASSVNDEFKQITSQVTGFFGNIFKEVKSTADEFIKDVSPSKLFMDPQSTTVSSPPSQRPSVAPDSNRGSMDIEQYEIELAIAMSLAEMQDRKGSVDITSYSPTKASGMPASAIQEDEEEGLVRASKSDPNQ
jgi:hypothetical protein